MGGILLSNCCGGLKTGGADGVAHTNKTGLPCCVARLLAARLSGLCSGGRRRDGYGKRVEREGKAGDGDDGASITSVTCFSIYEGWRDESIEQNLAFLLGNRRFLLFSLFLSVCLLVWSGKRVRFGWLDVQKM